MKIDSKTALFELIIDECNSQNLSEIQLCKRAGVSLNTIYNLRRYPRRSINLTTAMALVQTLGLEFYAQPPKNDDNE